MKTSIDRPRLLALAALHLAVAGGCGGASDPPDAGEGSSGAMSTGVQEGAGTTETPPPATESAGSSESSSSSGGESTTAVDSTGETADTGSGAVPTIVELDPADGAVGIAGDTTIVVRFSEPMDLASVQQAYQSADIPAAAVTFEWNRAGDELTVVPNDALPYALGNDPDTLVANAFAYTITTVAESADGVALERPVEVSFTTLRRVSQHIERDEALSSQMRDDGFFGLQPYIGDYTLDEHTRRYLLSFDLSGVPAELDTLEQAELSAAWSSDLGDPWISMGGVLFRQVSFSNLAPATFDGPAHTDNYALFVDESNFVSVDVAAELQAVRADPATFAERLQFRLRWAIENNFDMDHDGLTLDEDLLELDLQYLIP